MSVNQHGSRCGRVRMLVCCTPCGSMLIVDIIADVLFGPTKVSVKTTDSRRSLCDGIGILRWWRLHWHAGLFGDYIHRSLERKSYAVTVQMTLMASFMTMIATVVLIMVLFLMLLLLRLLLRLTAMMMMIMMMMMVMVMVVMVMFPGAIPFLRPMLRFQFCILSGGSIPSFCEEAVGLRWSKLWEMHWVQVSSSSASSSGPQRRWT